MSFPRYPKYKDSGVEWLGEVPEHWKISRLSDVCKFCSGKAHEQFIDEEGEFICVNSRFVSTEGESKKFCSVNFSPAKKNDILMVMSDLPNGRALAKAFFVSDEKSYAVNQRVCILTADKDSPRYLFYLLNRNPLFLLHDDGVNQTHLSNAVFTKFPTHLPPLPEQTRIAAFLDRETAKIDGLVAEQQRLIDLLKEKRQAVISHAVTKGLNPADPMKPSGIEWLGDVPAHWKVMTLRRCSSRVQTGGTPSTEPPSTDLEHGLVWYTPGDFSDSLRLTESVRKISQLTANLGEAKIFPPRSVLIVSIGATLGKVGFSEFTSSANQQINAVVPNEKVDGYFLAYSLSVKAEVMRYLSNASTIGIMNQEKTKDIWLVLPSRHEQTSITTFIDTETAKIDTLTAEAQRAIDLLHERRTALISAAVTGQIDVSLAEAGAA